MVDMVCARGCGVMLADATTLDAMKTRFAELKAE
jgi:hypothetical protein